MGKDKSAKESLAIIDRDKVASSYPLGVDWDIEIPDIDLTAKLDQAVANYADQPAINFKGKKLTYRQLGELVDRAAKGLQKAGIGKGSKVGLYMPNTPYYPVMFYAALKVGACVVNCNTLATQKQIAEQIADSDTNTLVTVNLKSFQDNAEALQQAGLIDRVISCPFQDMMPERYKFMMIAGSYLGFIRGGKKIVKKADNDNTPEITSANSFISFNSLISNAGNPAPGGHTIDDEAVLQPTGGTTGGIKHAVLSHFNLVANAEQSRNINIAMPDTPPHSKLMRPGEEKVVAALPYFHVFGMMVAMITPLEAGAELLIEPDPAPEKVMQTIHNERPRIMPVVPQLLEKMLESRKFSKYDLSSIETVISGGEALPPQLREDFETAVGKPDSIFQGYGLTEASPVVTFTPPSSKIKPASSGLPLPRTQIAITQLENSSKLCAFDEPGEIWVYGPQVMQHYYKKPEMTQDVLHNGWLRTGDVGYLDGDCHLHVVDRAKRMINVAGENIYPGDIEAAINSHPDVAEAVVIGVKDDRGEVAKAFVHFRDDLATQDTPDKETLHSFLAERLNRYQQPRYIEYRAAPLPRTSVGKFDFKQLEREAESNHPERRQHHDHNGPI